MGLCSSQQRMGADTPFASPAWARGVSVPDCPDAGLCTSVSISLRQRPEASTGGLSPQRPRACTSSVPNRGPDHGGACQEGLGQAAGPMHVHERLMAVLMCPPVPPPQGPASAHLVAGAVRDSDAAAFTPALQVGRAEGLRCTCTHTPHPSPRQVPQAEELHAGQLSSCHTEVGARSVPGQVGGNLVPMGECPPLCSQNFLTVGSGRGGGLSLKQEGLPGPHLCPEFPGGAACPAPAAPSALPSAPA